MNPDASWELQVIGVEDGGFSRELSVYGFKKTLLVCVLLRGMRIDDFRADMITVDGLDASEKLINMLRNLAFDVVMLAGVSFAGFNLVDPTLVFEEFYKPIILVLRTKPNNIAVKNALLLHFEDWQARWSVFKKLGPIYEVASMPGEPPIYVEVVSATLAWATKLIRALASCCRIPEPIRVARLIARGLTRKAKQS